MGNTVSKLTATSVVLSLYANPAVADLNKMSAYDFVKQKYGTGRRVLQEEGPLTQATGTEFDSTVRDTNQEKQEQDDDFFGNIFDEETEAETETETDPENKKAETTKSEDANEVESNEVEKNEAFESDNQEPIIIPPVTPQEKENLEGIPPQDTIVETAEQAAPIKPVKEEEGDDNLNEANVEGVDAGEGEREDEVEVSVEDEEGEGEDEDEAKTNEVTQEQASSTTVDQKGTGKLADILAGTRKELQQIIQNPEGHSAAEIKRAQRQTDLLLNIEKEVKHLEGVANQARNIEEDYLKETQQESFEKHKEVKKTESMLKIHDALEKLSEKQKVELAEAIEHLKVEQKAVTADVVAKLIGVFKTSTKQDAQ